MSSTKLEEFSNYIELLKKHSVSTRESLPPGIPAHVPDVLDQALAILLPILAKQTDSTSAATIDRESFLADLKSREKNLITHVQQTMKMLADRVDALQEVVDRKENALQLQLNKLLEKHAKQLSQKKSELNAIANEEETAFQSQHDTEKQKEKAEYENYESQLSNVLKGVSNEYQHQIDDIDKEITSSQQTLQDLIHSKHQQNQLRGQELEAEDRRMANEHERISREYQERKKKAETEVSKFQADFQSLSTELADRQDNSQAHLEELEEKMLQEKEKKASEQDDILMKLRKEVEDLTGRYKAETILYDSLDTELLSKLHEIEKVQSQKLRDEESATSSAINEQLAEINVQYDPIIKRLTIEIDDSQYQRGIALEALKKDQQVLAESEAMKLIEMNRKQQDEAAKYKRILKEQQEELHNLKNERDQDLEDLRHSFQATLGSKMARYDELDRIHQEEISKLMKQHEDQQNRLSEMHRQSLEHRDKHRAAEIARLKHEHEMRKKAILLQIDQQQKAEIEKELREQSLLLNEDHSKEIRSITDRIMSLKDRVDMLNLKIEGLYKINDQQLQQMTMAADETLAEDLKKLSETGDREKADIKNIKERLMNETHEVERRKQLVLEEADSVNDKISNLQHSFEDRMSKIQSKFETSRQYLGKKRTDIDIRQSILYNETQSQKAEIDQFHQIVQTKEKEIQDFQENFEEAKEDFKVETQAQYEAKIKEERLKPQEFMSEMNELRETLCQRIHELTEQLNDARQNTEKTTQLLLMERSQRLEEAEALIRTEFDARMQLIQEESDEREIVAKRDRAEFERQHETLISKLRLKFEEEKEMEEKQFSDLISELQEEKDRLVNESTELKTELTHLQHRECPSCREKRDIIDRLKGKRDEKRDGLLHMKRIQQENEVKMDNLFRRKIHCASSPKRQGMNHGPYSFQPNITVPHTSSARAILM